MNWRKTFDCGCTLLVDLNDGEGSIIMCPKHAAAPDMYEAIKNLLSSAKAIPYSMALSGSRDALTQALAKAEGKC